MNRVRSSSWLILFSLVFIVNLINVHCSETTFNNEIIAENEMQEKARKNVTANLDQHEDPNTAEVNTMVDADAQYILDINNKLKSGTKYRTAQLERSPSAVHSFTVRDISESNGTDSLLHLYNNDRRSARQVKESQRCQRLPLKINFRDIQMVWIHSPKEYNAYYCDGQCNHPLVDKGVTNHAKFQSNLHFQKPKEVRDPCCVPTELSDLEITYFVGRTQKKETMKDMVVEKCGCR